MGKNKTHEHSRARHRGLESPDEVDQGIRELKERIPQIEELKKDGLPYLDALRVKADFQLRETIKEVFGDKSPEFEEYRGLKIRSCSSTEITDALAVVHHLILLLEDKKLDLADGGHRYADRVAGGRRAPVSARNAEPPAVAPAVQPFASSPAPAPQKPAPAPVITHVAPHQAPAAGAPVATPPMASPPPRPIPPPKRVAAASVSPTTSRKSSPMSPAVPEPAPAASAERASAPATPSSLPPVGDALGAIRKICTRLHPVARQLRQRMEERSTLEVEDEGDAQDVVRALLCLDFDEITTEEWTPEYGNGRPREDIVLEREGIVVQVKRTKHGFGPKEINSQLAIDIQHYITHPVCKTLFCFIYDPEGRIGNPRGLEAKLTGEIAGHRVEVLIAPK
jgi:hypothetical protein